MRKLIWLIPLLLAFTLAHGKFGQGEGSSGGGGLNPLYDTDLDTIVDVAASIEGGSIGAAAVSDSCDSVRIHAQKYIEDSLDSYLLITRHNDSIAELRANMAETSAVYAGDSIAQARLDAQGYIADSGAVFRANMAETSAVYAGDSVAQARLDAQAYIEDSLDNYLLISSHNDSIAELRANAAESTSAAITIMKASPQTISAKWKFDGGDLEVADGQKLFVTDGDEDDTLYVQIVNDTARVWVSSGLPLLFGEEGKTTTDSLEIGGGATIKKWVQVGSFMAFIENDDDTTYATSDTTAVGGDGVMSGADIADSLDNADRTLANQFTFTDTIDVQNAIQRKDTTLIAAPGQGLFFGKEAGLSITTGTYNNFFGWQAGKAKTTGSENISIGRVAAPLDTAGNANVVIGNEAAYSSKEIDYNTIIGMQAGYDNITGSHNTYIGKSTGQNTLGQENVYVGSEAGRGLGDGNASYNVGIGREACRMDSSGDYNTALGWQALYSNIVGNTNVALGAQAGYSALGNYNIFIGRQAGYNETGAEKLYIENSNADSSGALIYGEFDTNLLNFNAKVQVDSLVVGPAGAVITKIVKVGSYLAIILSGADTLWAAADTTTF